MLIQELCAYTNHVASCIIVLDCIVERMATKTGELLCAFSMAYPSSYHNASSSKVIGLNSDCFPIVVVDAIYHWNGDKKGIYY